MTRPLRIAIVLGVALGGAILLALVFRFDPTTAGFFPPCIFHSLTGYMCPGCGMTRGLHALLHGDVVTAWNFNPLMFFVLPLVAVLAVWEGLRFVGAKLPALRISRWAIWAGVVVALLFGIGRNLG